MSENKQEEENKKEESKKEEENKIEESNNNNNSENKGKEEEEDQGSSLILKPKEKNKNPYVQIGAPNPRGVPAAPFITDIDNFMKNEKESADDLLRDMQMTFSKYKFMESQLIRSRESIKSKLPEIKKTLDMVEMLASKKTTSCHFEIANQVYANANIKETKSVVLSLGANVMVEYSFEEATKLLKDQLLKSEVNLRHLLEDTQFLKEQITTCEVNTARIYNYTVKEGRAKKN